MIYANPFNCRVSWHDKACNISIFPENLSCQVKETSLFSPVSLSLLSSKALW